NTPRCTVREDDVNHAEGSNKVLYILVTIALQQLDDVAANAPLGGDVLQQLHQLLVGLAGGTGAAQQRDVAGLDGQAEGVDGDVRAGLVDHAHHAERGADLLEVDAVRAGVAADDLSHRVRQADDLAQP